MQAQSFRPIELSQAYDARLYGGKAANLARSIQSGFPVPPGFVIPRQALTSFLDAYHLAPEIQGLVESYPRLKWQARQRQYQALRSRVANLPVLQDLCSAIDPAVQDLLGASPSGLAVRSSGLSEDQAKASFAGIYESHLGVTSLDSFWQKVVNCWCSAWSPQAAAYAQAYAPKMDLDLTVDGMAVLVQRMVAASSAGVVFTADPLSGDPWRFVINATFGLACDLADGTAPADHFILEWNTSQILETHLVSKPSALVFRDGKIIIDSIPETQQRVPSLNDPQIQQIARLALDVDRSFDRRMDIEWALAGYDLYLLQARPITALPAFFPHQLSEEEAGETWTPYLNTYANLNPQESLVAPFCRDTWMLELWNRYLTHGDAFPHQKGLERDFNGYRYHTEWKWGGDDSDPGRIESWLDVHETRLRSDWLAQLDRVQVVNRQLDEAIRVTTRAVDWVRLALDYSHEQNHMQAAVWYAPQWMIFTCEYLLKGFLDTVIPEGPLEGLPAGLLLGLPSFAAERAGAALALGRKIDEEVIRMTFIEKPLSQVIPYLGRTYPDSHFMIHFIAFCRHYGYKPSGETGINPVDKDINGVLLLVKTGLLDPEVDVQKTVEERARRRETCEEDVRTYIRSHRPEQLERFNKLLDWTQFWTPALNNRGWHITMTLRQEELFRRTGKALVAEGLVDLPEHFLLLTRQDWSAYVVHPDPGELRCLYRQRRHEYERQRRLEPLPFLGKPPVQPETITQKDARPEPATLDAGATRIQNILQGEGLAPGNVRGIVRKVANLDDPDYIDSLSKEHILVCGPDSFTAEWRRDYYALFLIVRGLVTVRGTQLHHATQIARECGVPIINLQDKDFEAIPDGAWIEMDGQAGRIIFLDCHCEERNNLLGSR